jgi:hypothetical protein
MDVDDFAVPYPFSRFAELIEDGLKALDAIVGNSRHNEPQLQFG